MSFNWLKRWTGPRPLPRPTPRRKARFAPGLESLEDRNLLNAGGLDPTFGLGGKVSLGIPGGGLDVITAVKRLGNGQVVVVGYATLPGGNRDFAVARYNADGTLDPNFGQGGLVTTDFQGGDDRAFGVAVQLDGKIVVAGYATTGFGRVFAAARYLPNGDLDVGNFTATGKAVNNLLAGAEAHSVAIQGDGKIVVAGWREVGGVQDFAVGRFKADGGIDGSFGPANGAVTLDIGNGQDRITSMVIHNGMILVGGSTTINNISRFALARYDLDGNLDNNFDNNGLVVLAPMGVVDEIHGLAVQTDGKIVAAGYSIGNNTTGDFALVRLNDNGSLDDGGPNDATPGDVFGTAGMVFTDFGGDIDMANGVAIQADGKIVAVGQAAVNGQEYMGVARYNADGSVDTGFGTGGKVTIQVNGVNSLATGVALQPDGNIVVAGYTNSNGGDFALVRLLGVDTPPPTVTNPAVPLTINSPTAALAGTAAAGSLVRVYRDVNGNGALDPGTDVQVGSQQLAGGGTAWSITVGLTPDSVNRFLVTAQAPGAAESAAAVVPPITEVNQIRNVTAQLSITVSRARRLRITSGYRQLVRIRNVGGNVIGGPLTLVLDGLPKKVKLRNRSGFTLTQAPLGSPHRTASPGGDNVLSPGEEVVIELRFATTRAKRIRYSPRVLAGVGLP